MFKLRTASMALLVLLLLVPESTKAQESFSPSHFSQSRDLQGISELNLENWPAATVLLQEPGSTGWSDEAIGIGYVAAPTAATLMFISSLVNEWNAGIAGLPATSIYLLAPPLIWMGGRSAGIPLDQGMARAKLGWVLYALALVPTGLAMYEFTTDWGANLPLTISSGILGTASILAMTSYATLRRNLAKDSWNEEAAMNLGICPLPGGGMLSLSYRF